MKYCIYLLVVLLAACSTDKKKETPLTKVSPSVSVDSIGTKPPNADSLVWKASEEVLRLLKNKAFQQLTSMFHPVLGVRFSPYGFVDTTTARIFNAETFIKSIQDKEVLFWGNFDGSGDSILLSTAAYYNKFIYNADFLHARKKSLNRRISAGNSLDNIEKLFPGCVYTEHYFPGFDKKYGGLDWTTLKLVFKFYNGKHYLVAVVHDQWTT